ncbi:MAG: FecR domain-containing protein [Ferruginibacter sp.]
MTNSRLYQLLRLYFQDQIGLEELHELQYMVSHDTDTKILDEFLQNAYADPQWAISGDFDKEKVYEELLEKLTSGKENPVIILEPAKRKWLAYWRIAAAVAVITVLSIGSYLIFSNKKAISEATITNRIVVNDIKAPESNKAIITLANGKTVSLDSVNRGLLIQQGNVKLIKLTDGKIAYQAATGEVATDMEYNTLTNPRGSKVIDMTLSDGSHVWLNAGSSVTYPVEFAGNERRVSIIGEAYFEVTHNALKPFYVTKSKIEVKVLGTHFNINAYNDEADIKVTLLEGSVKVSNYGKAVTIKPGEQASVIDHQKLLISNNIDLNEVMAWKNGRFVFSEKTDIQTIMRQIARWYNVNLEYKGVVTNHFWGSISNDVKMSDVLKMLETTGGVTFNVEGDKVVVMPGK